MATQTYLISVDTLKTFYPVDENVQQHTIISNIQKAESFQILPLIGRTKYVELIDYVNSIKTGGTRNSSYDEMIGVYIEPIIGWFVVGEILYSNTFKTKNIGLANVDQNIFYGIQKTAQKYKDDSNGYVEIFKNYLGLNDIKISEDYTTESSIFLGDTSENDKTIIGKTTIYPYSGGLYI